MVGQGTFINYVLLFNGTKIPISSYFQVHKRYSVSKLALQYLTYTICIQNTHLEAMNSSFEFIS